MTAPLDASVNSQNALGGADALWRFIAEGDQTGLQSAFSPALAHARDARGDTPLMIAARCGNQEALRFLIPRSELDARNDEGNTALMVAILGSRETAIAMLAPLSDMTAKNNDGFPPLGLLLDSWANPPVAAQLVRPFLPASDPCLRSHKGWMTPFELMAHLQNWPVLDLFLCVVDSELARETTQKFGKSHFPAFRARQDAAALQETLAQVQSNTASETQPEADALKDFPPLPARGPRRV